MSANYTNDLDMSDLEAFAADAEAREAAYMAPTQDEIDAALRDLCSRDVDCECSRCDAERDLEAEIAREEARAEMALDELIEEALRFGRPRLDFYGGE